MFGKGKTRMSMANKFVMAEGRRVGNIRPPMKAEKITPASPVQNKAGLKGRENLGAIGKVKT